MPATGARPLTERRALYEETRDVEHHEPRAHSGTNRGEELAEFELAAIVVLGRRQIPARAHPVHSTPQSNKSPRNRGGRLNSTSSVLHRLDEDRAGTPLLRSALHFGGQRADMAGGD